MFISLFSSANPRCIMKCLNFEPPGSLNLGFCESLTLPFHGVECVATALEYMQLVVASIHHSPSLNPTIKAVNFHVKLRLRQPRFWNSSPASYPS